MNEKLNAAYFWLSQKEMRFNDWIRKKTNSELILANQTSLPSSNKIDEVLSKQEKEKKAQKKRGIKKIKIQITKRK